MALAPARFGPVLRRDFIGSLGVLVAAIGCKKSDGSSAGAASAKKLRIAVIPKGTTHEFWKAAHAGAAKAAKELGVEIVWKGPLKEDDLKSQVDLVQSFAAQGVAGMVLAPLNDSAPERHSVTERRTAPLNEAQRR